MSGVALTGSLPGLINENTALWDWSGQLRLTINPALIRFVDLQGMGSNFFDVSLNRSTGMLTITPIANADHEWFVANNISTNIGFSLRFFMMDGSVLNSLQSYFVQLQNQDDTPPQALTFASGGTVAAGAVGANIGSLLVGDPDTLSGFTFTIREDDQWMFEIVGNMLKLRAGISIPLADGPERALVILVSDGTQSVALTLQIGVTAAGINNGGTVDLMELHESVGGFRWASPNNLFSMKMSFDIASLRDYGSLIHVQLRDGTSLTVQQPAVIDLLDGYITFSGDGFAGRVWTIYETVLNREPQHSEMAAGVARLVGGTTNASLAGELLASGEFAATFGTMSNSAFAALMYRNSVGWTDQSGINWHTGRMDQGRTREAVTNDFLNWRLNSLNHADQRAENGGFFVPRSWLDALDNRPPATLDEASFGQWWAAQVIGGHIRLDALPDVFMLAQGLVPQIGAVGRSSWLERLMSDMTGAPAESTWATSFAKALEKNGMTSAQYLEKLVKNLDLEAAYDNLLPQGVTFQAGW